MKFLKTLGLLATGGAVIGYLSLNPDRIEKFEGLIGDYVKAENSMYLSNTASSKEKLRGASIELEAYDVKHVPEVNLLHKDQNNTLEEMVKLGYVYARFPSLSGNGIPSTIFGKIKGTYWVENEDWDNWNSFSVISYKPLVKSYDNLVGNASIHAFWRNDKCFIDIERVDNIGKRIYNSIDEYKTSPSFGDRMLAKVFNKLDNEYESDFTEFFRKLVIDSTAHHEARHDIADDEADAFLTQIVYSDPHYALYVLSTLESQNNYLGESARKIFRLLKGMGFDSDKLLHTTDNEIKEAARKAHSML